MIHRLLIHHVDGTWEAFCGATDGKWAYGYSNTPVTCEACRG